MIPYKIPYEKYSISGFPFLTTGERNNKIMKVNMMDFLRAFPLDALPGNRQNAVLLAAKWLGSAAPLQRVVYPCEEQGAKP